MFGIQFILLESMYAKVYCGSENLIIILFNTDNIGKQFILDY